MRFDAERGGLLADERRVADELDRIAKAVQTAQHHALARKLFSVPEAKRVRDSGRALPRFDPLTLHPRALVSAQQHQALPAAGCARIGIGAGLLGFNKPRKGCLHTALCQQRMRVREHVW